MIMILLFLPDFWLEILNLIKKSEALKKIIEESMPVVWHPGRWWNFYMLEDEKKETEPTFTE